MRDITVRRFLPEAQITIVGCEWHLPHTQHLVQECLCHVAPNPETLRQLANTVFRLFYFVVCLSAFLDASITYADEWTKLDTVYQSDILPLLRSHCYECHSGDTIEAAIDLSAYPTVSEVRRHSKVWQKVSDVLLTEQMPPADSKPLTTSQRKMLKQWVRSVLLIEAEARAGDPGPVVLRRLSNAEYTYTLQDLTGLSSFEPAREFPIDSASGEGFTNVGNSLVMSPSLLVKYFDAAKAISNHAVFLPRGMKFSPYVSQRDWTNEYLTEIRDLYRQYSHEGGGAAVNLQGVQFDTNLGGLLPVEKYLLATIEERESLAAGGPSFQSVADQRGLSPKYLESLWNELSVRDEQASSLLMSPLRERWKTSGPDDVAALMELIRPWQSSLWRFNAVGQIGLHAGVTAWQTPASPVVNRLDVRQSLPAGNEQGEVVISLATFDIGDGAEHDDVVWERPRFVSAGRPDLLLKEIPTVYAGLVQGRKRHFAQAARCLAAVAEAGQASEVMEVTALAKKHGVDEDSLSAWLEYLGISTGGSVMLGAPLTRQLEQAEGNDSIQGWVGDDALSVVANSSDQHVRIPGNMKPHGVAVHPSPTLSVAVGWKSPFTMTLQIDGSVQHAHPECGNGVEWTVELRRGNTRQSLAAGVSQGAAVIPIGPLKDIAVRAGDVITLMISPRDGNHSCDLTAIDLQLSDGTHTWNLAKDLSTDILAGNPHADQLGHPGVWHFFSEPTSGGTSHVIPAGSVLARWQATSDSTEKEKLAAEVQTLLQSDPKSLTPGLPDTALSDQLRSFSGPFMSAGLSSIDLPESGSELPESSWGLPVQRFGTHPDGAVVEEASMCIKGPHVTEIRLPAELVSGAEFVTSAVLHPVTAREGAVQVSVVQGPASVARPLPSAPILVHSGSDAAKKIEQSFEEFRALFPPTLCYTQIVPVDEVVTLNLFYREDDHLKRLMLTDSQSAHLDQLWDELLYVSREPTELVTAITQLYQFATQDRSDLLKAISDYQVIVNERARIFQERLHSDEPAQLDSMISWASHAFRRPLTNAENEQLRALYRKLREEQIEHEEALRLLLARMLVSPEFLYHLEKPAPGTAATPVNDYELASRLSYFLWSTMPDERLLKLASEGQLSDPDVLAAEARRMLAAPQVRRLATEFGTHWLHVHGVDQLDEKSERHFPTFLGLREAMHEESLLVLTDLFQNNRSLLSLIDGDATFLNSALANHYGIPGVEGEHWRRVEGVRKYSRGSILSLASSLSKQSGASRTSPILRGTWISEAVLGEVLPKPPKNVPPLAEAVTAGLTERQMTQLHSSEPSCAKCHVRIDPLGYALEGFDAIGRQRTHDASGLPIDSKSVLFDGTQVSGLDDLKNYVGKTRRLEYTRQFTKKLLGYALGRAVLLSDEPLLSQIQTQLEENDFRVRIIVDAIVRSRQFREIRGKDTPDEL